jgi:hypothetical protein
VGGVTLALLIVIAITGLSGSSAKRTVSASPSSTGLPYFGLIPGFVYDANRGQVVLFDNRGQTWLWAKNQWTQAHPALSPPGRIGAAAAWDPLMGAVLLFGGRRYADQTILHDTWTWNGSTWREVGTRTIAPPGGVALAMAYDSDLEEMVLVESGTRFGAPIRLWTWDGATWHQRSGAGGPVSPVGVIAFDPLTETVLGVAARCSGSYCVSETWSWDGGAWQQLKPAHEPGFAFSSMVLVPDPISRRLLLLTVAPNTTGPAPTETWTWDGQDWSREQTIGEQGALAVAASSDGVHGMVLAFEDVARDFSSLRIDTWEWTGNSWRPISARSGPG